MLLRLPAAAETSLSATIIAVLLFRIDREISASRQQP
jgi:hypothetical protein